MGVASGSCPEGVWGVQGVLEALKQKIERQLQGGQGVWVVRGGQAAQKRKQAVWGALGPSEGAQEEAQSQELGWQSWEVGADSEGFGCWCLKTRWSMYQ